MASAYRDGVFSVASPAPRYGTLMTAFEDGSLGGLDDDAAAALDPVLDSFVIEMGVTAQQLPAGNTAAVLAAQTALALAQSAQRTLGSQIDRKIALTLAAAYAASNYWLPPNALMGAVSSVMDTFALTAHQRNALRQEAAALYLEQFQQAKGNPMSGGILGSAYKDGVLGTTLVPQDRAYADGVLGRLVPQDRAYADGVLGRLVHQNRAYADGSLGRLVHQNRAYADGSLGLPRPNLWERLARLTSSQPSGPHVAAKRPRKRMAAAGFGALSRSMRSGRALPAPSPNTSYLLAPQPRKVKGARPVQGLGCGCSGVGADALPTPDPPLYKKPIVIGGAAVALGLVLYAVTQPKRRRR